MIGYAAMLPPRDAGGTDRHAESRLPGRRRTDNHGPGSLAQDVRYLDPSTRQPLGFEHAGPANRCYRGVAVRSRRPANLDIPIDQLNDPQLRMECHA